MTNQPLIKNLKEGAILIRNWETAQFRILYPAYVKPSKKEHKRKT